MSCNWELYELRMRVWIKAKNYPHRGYFGLGMLFWNISLDLLTVGINNVKPSNVRDVCGFKAVFDQLSKLQMVPFTCSQNANRGPFGRTQTAERNSEHFPAAFLFIHRRDQSDLASETTGIGVLLENVTVIFTSLNQDSCFVQLSGDSAKTVNF